MPRFPILRLVPALVLLALVAASCTEPRARAAVADGAGSDDPEWTLRSERSDFEETATYDEVMDYLERAAATHPSLHLTRFGYTNEGRALPLLVAGPVAGPSPSDVREASGSDGLPVVYLQGNIHAGEVAGKEALLRLVRDLVHDRRPELLEDLVLLVGPIYNADGNERLDLRNRPRQHGPIAGMGTRPNAQGLDLNRDQMKLDSPEGRSLARLMTEYDPHVVMDLHTTNGTRHAYHLTYSPPLHPATPAAIDDLLRDELLPAATRGVEDRYGWHMYHYGNVSERGGVRGWYTFDHRPRFVTNYTGLRNRLGVLSEAYSYATFEDRILATERFVDEVLDWTRTHAGRVMEVVRQEDARDLRGTRIAVRAGFPDGADLHPILMGEVEEEIHPLTGQILLRRLDVVREEPMPSFVAFAGTEEETVPHAYLVPRDLVGVIDRLRAHGIRVEEPEVPGGAPEVQRFAIRSVTVASQAFQGRNEVTLEGEWEPLSDAAPEGEDGEGARLRPGGPLDDWYLVPMDQPLARLAFLLLEPRADDGLLNWGLMDGRVEEGGTYPVHRVVGPETR